MKKALVLGGGGAKGAFHIGVWKAIMECNIQLDLVVGTSVGALIGAFIAQKEWDKAFDIWTNVSTKDVFNITPEMEEEIAALEQKGISLSAIKLIRNQFAQLIKDKGFDISPLRTLVYENLDEDKLRNSDIDFGLVTVDRYGLKPMRKFVKDIPVGELKYYLMGSANILGFKRDKKTKHKFLDGGFYDNLPLKMARNHKEEDIIMVNLYKFRDFRKMMKFNGTLIVPSDALGNMLYFTKNRSIRNIQMGYLDALKAFGKVEGNRYYFVDLPDEDLILSKLFALDITIKTRLAKYFYRSIPINHKSFIEKVIPKLTKHLGCVNNCCYHGLFIEMLEFVAKKQKIKRLVSYHVSDFINQIDFNIKTKDVIYSSILEIIKLFKN